MPKFGDDYEFPDELEQKTKQAAAEDKFEIAIEIEDDTPPADRGRKPMKEPVEDPTDEELESYDEKVQNRIKKFTRGYHDERRAKEEALREREAAEAFARQVLEDNKRLQQQLATGSKALIESTKSAAETQLETAKRKLKEAHENGDYDAVADAQADIARATASIDRVQHMRPHEVEEREFQPAQPQQQQQPLSRRTQAWVEKNADWWGVDEEMTAAAMGLDKKLARQYGAEYVGSKEYFQAIDNTMRKRFPEYFDDTQSDEDNEPPQKRAEPVDEEKPQRRASKPATVVAPASRSTPPSRVKLKASEAAIARRLGIPLEEYAKQVALLERG
jgi:LysM repeat protein